MPRRSFLFLVLGVQLLIVGPAQAKEPLHRRIDAAISGGKADFWKPASDAEFLRRIYLDLLGTIPSASEARAFLDDPAPDKRAKLIDRLLDSPEHARYLATVFDVLLMERRPSKHVPQAQWLEYLRESFAANQPWDELVRELLSADGSDPKTRPAARFYLDRDGEPHLLTKDISRLFLARNYSCNQCHDSPVVDAYKQDHYYGIFAFLNRGFLFAGKDKLAVYAEKGEGDVTFQSVFDPKVTKSTGPKLPGGDSVEEPKFEKGAEYDVAPAKDVRPIPKFSRRSQLAPLLATRENQQFKRNIANRLWALMMGRGLVHPVDLDHESNPPSHPELLDLLAGEVAEMNFDMRAFLRELALSQTYQRSSEPPGPAAAPPDKGGQAGAPPERFAVARLRPLTAEQLGWSLMQATGLTDAERLALGKNLNEKTLYAKLAPSVAQVVAIFGSKAGEPEGQAFQATLDQALFVSNGPLLRGWLASRAGNLTDRLAKLEDSAKVAEELYLSVLTRRPSDEEQKEIVEYLQKRAKDRPAAVQDLVWALVASAEFRFNH